ncbi:MAG: UbiH/UbiF family hydroxylase [Pseudochelatococcus sp.]|jgi:2-octaprenyl-6-methoxyphenol hydroxylase|uniref:UbiH/UbiF family hydroxylase n=1 Tax=Pseudochelatococcus sp. TaxID=2020869 RepID=UPI003D9338BC
MATDSGVAHDFDIVVAGAGPAGLATAIALANEGFATALVGEAGVPRDGRTVALLDGSVRFLKAIGVWERIAPDAAPMTQMRIVDATGSLFRPPPVTFHAREIGLDAFGHNIENTKLVAHLAEEARARAGLALFPARAAGFAADDTAAAVTLADGRRITARLAAGAEGRQSTLRRAAGIGTRTWAYPQTAVTAILSHARDHGGASTEFHTRAGPFTLVPLPGRLSSLVWVNRPQDAARLAALDDASFARAVENEAHSLLGAMQVAGPRGAVPLSGMSASPLTARRLVLIGEAAHVFPPIGAQGLNLGLRDGAALRDAVADARDRAEDIGAAQVLARFGRGRAADTQLRTGAIDLLNRTLLADMLPADLLRGAGLLALGLIAPLRRMVMREGLTPGLGTPRQMRRAPRGRAGEGGGDVVSPALDQHRNQA